MSYVTMFHDSMMITFSSFDLMSWRKIENALRFKSPETLQAPSLKVRRGLLSQQDIRHLANRAVTPHHVLQQPAQKAG